MPQDDAELLQELRELVQRKRVLKRLLKRLTWNPGAELSQEEVAAIQGTSRHEIRRVEARALIKCRQALKTISPKP